MSENGCIFANEIKQKQTIKTNENENNKQKTK